MEPTPRALVALLVLGACGGPEPGKVPLPAPSLERFAASVQPVLETRCSSPSCHGDARRPFSLYAPLQRRLDPARLHLPEPVTADEVRRNRDAALGFLPRLLVCKGLVQEAGGCFHGGGPVFFSDREPDNVRIAAWAAESG